MRWGVLVPPALFALGVLTFVTYVVLTPGSEAVAAKPVPKPVPHYCTFDGTMQRGASIFMPCNKLKAYPHLWHRVYEDI